MATIRNKFITGGLAPLLFLAACGSGGGAGVPGDTSDTRPFAGIGEEDVLHVTGTEPFWNGEVRGGSFTYMTPENMGGTVVPVRRFAGRGGLSLSGSLDEQSLDMMVTEGACSDGMSDREYPFTVTVRIGEEVRSGCGWTDTRPYTDRRDAEGTGSGG